MQPKLVSFKLHLFSSDITMHQTAVFILASLAVNSLGANFGNVKVAINGQDKELSVLGGDWSRNYVSVRGGSITLRGGGRVYLGNEGSGELSPNAFYQASLLGKRLKFDVDLSQVGCSCNGALYAVSMPAYNSGQRPSPGSTGEYYCDANNVGGSYCPEMDIMEANKYAMASTAHTCQYSPPHYYSYCDHGGCGKNVLDACYGQFGPGKTIDTNKPFTLSVAFITAGGNLNTINNYFWQEGRSVQFDSCYSSYLQWMGKSLPGITLTMSLWGTGAGGMSWLDGKSGCYGGCNLGGSKVTFSNILIEDL